MSTDADHGQSATAVSTTAKEVRRVLGSDAAVAVGRFLPDGPIGYRAKAGGPLRMSRAEAEADQLAHLEKDKGYCQVAAERLGQGVLFGEAA